MRAATSLFSTLVTAAVLAVGCTKAPESPSTVDPSDASGETPAPGGDGAEAPGGDEAAAPEGDAPDGAKVVCHLDCSGNQAQGYGATEEEARADARTHVEELCKPEDGQFFIFCEPVGQPPAA